MALSSRFGDFVRSLSFLQRELALLGIGALLGFVVMPALTWAIGTAVFGKYAGGGSVFSLYGNFFKALGQGTLSFWMVAFGPYVLILVFRLLLAALRGPSSDKESDTPAPPKRRAPLTADEKRSPVPEARKPAREPNRAPPSRPATQPNRKAPPKPGERRTPFIKSID